MISSCKNCLSLTIAGWFVIGVFSAWIQLDPLPPPQDAARWAWSTVTGRTTTNPVDTVDHRHDAYG